MKMAAAYKYEYDIMEDGEEVQELHTELVDDEELLYLDVAQQFIIDDEAEVAEVGGVKCMETATESCDKLDAHTLLLKQADGGAQKKESYLCMQCDLEYASIEEFSQTHNLSTLSQEDEDEFLNMAEQQWEAVGSEADECAEFNVKQEFSADDFSVEFVEDNAQNETVTNSYNECYLQDQYEAEPDEALVVVQTAQTTCIKQELQVDANKAVVWEQQQDREEEDGQRYFCYECESVFGDLQTAEQHECPAIDGESDTIIADETSEIPMQQPRTPNPREHKCPICLRVFGSINALCSHSRTHKVKSKEEKGKNAVGRQTATCDVCNTTFGSEKNLRFHMKIHNKRPIKSIQEALPAGAKVQYNELDQFFCEICNKSFDEALLAVHKNMHQNMEEYNCGTCNRQFENLLSYEMHMKMHEDNKSGTGNRPQATSKTKAHAAETGKLRFPCQYCGHEFLRPHEKVKHERVHTGEKPYECEVCGKTFRVSYSLTLHLRTHTDIRPYVCATCNKRFKSQPVYVHHMKTHLNERAYKCDICGKAFRTAVQLCGHKNTHKKPFNCPECNRPFSTMYAVKIHMKTHKLMSSSNELLKYRCNYCGAVYARSYALQSHIKEQHAFEPETNEVIVRQEHASALPADAEDDVLIAVAAETDCAAYIEAMEAAELNDDAEMISVSESDIATQAILSNEEQIVVENFHTEEIVADWLSK